VSEQRILFYRETASIEAVARPRGSEKANQKQPRNCGAVFDFIYFLNFLPALSLPKGWPSHILLPVDNLLTYSNRLLYYKYHYEKDPYAARPHRGLFRFRPIA